MKWKRTFTLTAWMGLVLGLGSPAAAQEAPSRDQLPAFHDVHVNTVEIGCSDCHAIPSDPAPGNELSFSVRPGHDQCNICHDEFEEGEFINLCLTCHSNDSFDLGKFPSGNSSIGKFSHQQHVDPRGRVSRTTGQRKDCAFCHQVAEGEAGVKLPAHPQCKECHSGTAAAPPVIAADSNESCQGCHTLERIDYAIKHKGEGEYGAGMLPAWLKARLLATPAAAEEPQDPRGESWSDIVKFPHGKHIQEKTGQAINCLTCHNQMLTRGSAGAPLTYPTMNECAVCHRSASRVGSEAIIDNCEICHTKINEATLPGHKGHLPKIAHNPSFSANHLAQARQEEGYCTYCHDLNFVEGNGCDECHAQLKPKNHLAARFAETTHGRLAAMDREPCAACHQSDFCIRCHNIPPRSHSPLPIFATGGHRLLAAINLRSCFACHTFEEACLECHEPELRLPR